MSRSETTETYSRLNLDSFGINGIDSINQTLDKILTSSNEKLVQNTIRETSNLFDKAKQKSTTYKEKSEIFSKIRGLWFSLWRHYKSVPEAYNLMLSIDDLTNKITAYYRLYNACYLINENKTGDLLKDGAKVVTGFHWLSQTVDVYIDHIPDSELKQIYQQAKNFLIPSKLDVNEYLEEGLENSNLVTQFRAYCSLIILRIEEYCDRHEINLKNEHRTSNSSQPWWEQIAGTMSDDSSYDEAMKLGREYRESFRPNAE